jgi:hypothetical protein
VTAPVTFYDLLGIVPETPGCDAQAGQLWPNDKINATEGFNLSEDGELIAKALQNALGFDNVRAGADRDVQLGDAGSPGHGAPGQISLAADLHVRSDGIPVPLLYIRDLPNVGIQVLPTGTDGPATVFFAADGRGREVLVENLPVELQLPPGLIEPDSNVAEDGDPLDFDANDEDSLAVVKQRDPQRTRLITHVRLHLLPEGDVVLEPNTPISIDGAKVSGFPVEALHDVLLIPSPRRREYFEWARNDLTAFPDNPPAAGAIGFRAIGLDLDKAPFKELADRFSDKSGVQSQHVDLVLEDVVIPVSGAIPFPIPSHATLGLRRKITDRNDIAQAYSLKDAPFRLRIYTRDSKAQGEDGLYLFVDQLLFKTGSTRAHSDEAPVFEFQAGLYWQGAKGSTIGGAVGIGDDWLLQAGFTLGDASALRLLTIAGATVSLHAIHGGLRLRQISAGKDSWQVLADLSIKSESSTSGGAFQIASLSGKPLDLVLRDVGWSFGHTTMGKSIAAPEGVQLIFARVVRLIVEEMGWVEEPGGGTYFSFSGGVSIGFGGGDAKPPTSKRAGDGNSGGIRFRRLRFLTSDTPAAAPFKLDGIFLDLRYGPVKIAGFGYVSDETDSGFRYQEFGFGVKAEFPLPAVTASVAVEFLKGSRHATANPADGFEYFLASAQIGYIPAGPVGLYAIRLLVAYNMQPALDPPGENGESMVLYQWHKDHDGAIDMPRTRNLADWKPLDSSFAVGVGAGFSLNSCGSLFHIGAFVLVSHSEEDTLILIVGDVYLLKNPEPIAFAAIEYDFKQEKFGLMAGVDLTLDKFVGGDSVPKFIGRIARLSGTIYFGNEPWSLAIGQLADQRSWLGITIEVPLLEIKLRLALGLQITDSGPKGFGFVFAFSGGADWGIGAFIVFGSVGFIIGTWKTGSDSSGIHAWAEFGFKIHVFYVFHFGADIGCDITYLGKRPWYTTLAAQIHIDTPWFLPDVTFRFTKTWNESLPFDTATITQALSSGSASSPQAPGKDGQATLHVPPLADGNADPKRLYSLNQLAATSGAALEDVHLRSDGLTPVAVDADVCLEFANPLANDAAIAADTYAGGVDAGVQKVQDLTVRYALKSVSIKRSPRFGPGAGTWTDLVAAVDTELDLSGGGSVHAAPAVSFRWDSDNRADGVLSPKRLLINSRTPYSLVVGSTRNDEEALANDSGFPCCNRRKLGTLRSHSIDFNQWVAGERLPRAQRFSGDGDWWHWSIAPTTATGFGQLAGRVVALPLTGAGGVIGSVELSAPAFSVEVAVEPKFIAGQWTLEAYRGLSLVDTKPVNGAPGGLVSLRGTIDAGITRVVLRAKGGGTGEVGEVMITAAAIAGSGPGAVQVAAIAYVTCEEARAFFGRFARCRSGAELAPAVGGGGKLAFLPNHDYAVTATVEVTVSHKTGGSKATTLSQPAYFRTKGLLGLNACENVGDELRPYVASTYPANGTYPLYRGEPVALAFDEGMSNLLPVDRVAAPGDPPEKAQLMKLTLALERVASTEGVQRLTVPSGDWLTAHGGSVIFVPLLPLGSGGFVRVVVRKAASVDPRVRRFENLLDSGNCQHEPLHSSEVLLHEPVGPDGAPGLWEGQAGLRATVRAKDAPYTERARFEIADMAAFEFLSNASSAADWSFADGSIVAPAAGRAYAAFGEPSWNHLQVTARLRRVGSAAGVAIGVSGSSPVQQAMLALVEDDALVLVRRSGGVDKEVQRATLPHSGEPVDLHVTAFDDRVRAQVGEVSVEADRDPVREGRVALVSDGASRFDSLLVDGLDIYRVPFRTSRYESFADHIASREPMVASHEPTAMGAAPSRTPAQVLASDAGAIAAAMGDSADPQARQELFSRTLSAIGLPQLERCDRLTITRLADAGGASAILLESPEPISFVHDVTLGLATRTWRRLPWWGGLTEVDEPIHSLIPHIHLAEDRVLAPIELSDALLAGSHQLVHVAAEDPVRLDLFDPVDRPASSLTAVRSASLDAAAARAKGLGDLIEQPAGTIAAIRDDGSIAGAGIGGWLQGSLVHVDTPVPFTLLGNGDESAALVIPAAPLGAGTHVVTLKMKRTRWQSASADPEASYEDEASILLTW